MSASIFRFPFAALLLGAAVASPAALAVETVQRAADIPGLMKQAADMERNGNTVQAASLYQVASNRGHGPASLRLGELSLAGYPGHRSDYVEAVHWYSKARNQGEQVVTLEKR